jgi:hypothetical protein
MKPATIILGGALLLVTGSSAAIILKQRAEIDSLLARMSASTISRAPLLASDPAPVGAPAPAPEVETASPAADSPNPVVNGSPDGEVMQQRPDPRSRRSSRFAEILADPEVASLMKNQQKAELDGRYAALFRRLGMNPAEIDTLKELLAEKQLARIETRAVARAEGFAGNDREAYRDLMSESNDDIDAQIQDLLGADRFATLQRYEATQRERSRVNQLDQRLSYTGSPLQAYQTDALVEIIASAGEEPRPAGRIQSTQGLAEYLAELQAYDAAILSRARNILSPAQFEAARQLQQERINRVRLGELMRNRTGGRD